jgi:hypothetical protein
VFFFQESPHEIYLTVLDTGCGNDPSSNATIKHEVKEEIILEENNVRSENNEDQRFVVFSIKITVH